MIVNCLFALALFLSQFYFFDSGSIQPAHYLFVVTIGVVIQATRGNIPIGEKLIYFKPLFYFVIYAGFVNLLYATYFGSLDEDFEFTLSTAYFIYGLLVSIFISYQFDRNDMFKYYIAVSAFLGIYSIVVANLMGLGEYTIPPRYNGFFNDPNQMAFWALCCYTIFCLIIDGMHLAKLLLFFGCTFVVFVGISRSAFLGLIIMALGTTVDFLSKEKQRFDTIYRLIRRLSWVISLSVLGILIFVYGNIDIPVNMFDRMLDTNYFEQADDRGYGRIFDFPEYLFVGAGQGLDMRFGTNLEIHSTWAGVLFYYGFPGISMFIWFLKVVIERLNFYQICILMGPLVYGFSTFGLRTPIFWIVISAVIFAIQKRSEGGKGLSG